MFSSEINAEEFSATRRRFLLGAAATAAGYTLWSWGLPHMLDVSAGGPSKEHAPKEVTIVRFSDDGKRPEKVRLMQIVKSDDEWRKQLSSGEFEITRHADTEIAFTGKYWKIHDKGLFRCICCDSALFSSTTKFDSGTGWPSFWEPIARENVIEKRDISLGMIRTAVSCTLCEAHLGHVFDDGPPPTGLRYCMNSASLKFAAAT